MTIPESTSTLDLGDSIPSTRYHCQHPARSPVHSSLTRIPDSYGDDSFFPELEVHALRSSAWMGALMFGSPFAAAVADGPAAVAYSTGMRLTPAALAELGESHDSRLERWIEAVQYNNRIAVGYSGISTDHGDMSPATFADELIAVGGWCLVNLWEYPVVLQSEDMWAEEDAMSDWVEITHDEV